MMFVCLFFHWMMLDIIRENAHKLAMMLDIIRKKRTHTCHFCLQHGESVGHRAGLTHHVHVQSRHLL